MGALNRLFQRHELSSEKGVGKATERGRNRALDTFAVVGVVVAFLLLSLAQGQVVHAAMITVTTNTDGFDDDDGFCSLREAIQAANHDSAFDACPAGSGPDTISVIAGTHTLTKTGASEDLNVTGDLDITDDLTIIGEDATTTIIDGNEADRVFHVNPNSSTPFILNISGVTIRNGNAQGGVGGGINNNLCTLSITDSIVSENVSSEGGGIMNQGGGPVLTITNSTISGNSADFGGGIYNNGGTLIITSSTISDNDATRGGGIFEDGVDSTITNSTISDNSATVMGGGLDLDSSTTIVTNSTISYNHSADGGGISSNRADKMRLQNTILAWNTASNVGPDCYSAITSLGINLIRDDSDCEITETGPGNDLTGDPGLGNFTDNGTPGNGHFPLLSTSQVIDEGDTGLCPTTDQLGDPRPVDGDGDNVADCDIGAIEFQAVIAVEIDIKPGSDPNCFNSDGNGVIPVAILGSIDFDVATVDPFTVSLDGADVRVKGKSGNAGSLEDVNGDSLLDLVIQIIDDGAYAGGDTEATLAGETFDGTPIQGSDFICIVP